MEIKNLSFTKEEIDYIFLRKGYCSEKVVVYYDSDTSDSPWSDDSSLKPMEMTIAYKIGERPKELEEEKPLHCKLAEHDIEIVFSDIIHNVLKEILFNKI